MFNKQYEISCLITSFIITASSLCIVIVDDKPLVILVTLSGFTSLLTRFYRIYKEEYIMDHPIVYLDILLAIIAFSVFIYDPLDIYVNYLIIFSFILMITAAIMSWNIFPFGLIELSFYFQLAGHIIISYSLLYYVLCNSSILMGIITLI